MNISNGILSLIKELLPQKSNITISDALKQSNELKTLYCQNAEVKKLIDEAKVIQDLPWKFTTHKSAFVIAYEPLNLYFPARYYEGAPMIEWTLSMTEEMGIKEIVLEKTF